MRNISRLSIFAVFFLSLNVFAQTKPVCGAKPFPFPGCKIGQCIDGQWQQICTSDKNLMPCGIKPVPGLGCTIGQCKDGQWEQICEEKPFISCGPQPIPADNCTIGQCINGSWQMNCN